jgi:hypothetical protein
VRYTGAGRSGHCRKKFGRVVVVGPLPFESVLVGLRSWRRDRYRRLGYGQRRIPTPKSVANAGAGNAAPTNPDTFLIDPSYLRTISRSMNCRNMPTSAARVAAQTVQ